MVLHTGNIHWVLELC